MRICMLLLIVAAQAQTGNHFMPRFPREGVVPVWGKHAQPLMPKMLVSIYGRNLASPAGCAQEPPVSQGGPYPKTLCGTTVTVAGIPAGLLAVLDSQINLEIPAAAPVSGEAPIVVTVDQVSSAPVMVPFGKAKAILLPNGKAYVGMPVWIQVERPSPYDVYYPYALSPWDFDGCEFEVKKDGKPVRRIEYTGPRAIARNGLLNGTIAPAGSPRGRLPLHLQYRFDQPGVYSVRFTGHEFRDSGRGFRKEQVDESDWTDIRILPYSRAAHDAWERKTLASLPKSPGLLVGDAIPSLLASPDKKVLAALVPFLYNADDVVARFAAASLDVFDSRSVRAALARAIERDGPSVQIAYLIQRKDLSFGDDAKLMRIVTPYLKSKSQRSQAGAIQCLMNMKNGKANAAIVDAAPYLIEEDSIGNGEPSFQQLLTEALGAIKTDRSRELLWRMIGRRKAPGQALIALMWIADPRDLPRLGRILAKGDQRLFADELFQYYGNAALPYFKTAMGASHQLRVREKCAEYVALAGDPAGFIVLRDLMRDVPSSRVDVWTFVRGRIRGHADDSLEQAAEFVRKSAGE